MAEDAARELPNLPLEDALQLVHLYFERGSPKAEPAARRWLVRYLTEGTRACKTSRRSLRVLRRRARRGRAELVVIGSPGCSSPAFRSPTRTFSSSLAAPRCRARRQRPRSSSGPTTARWSSSRSPTGRHPPCARRRRQRSAGRSPRSAPARARRAGARGARLTRRRECELEAGEWSRLDEERDGDRAASAQIHQRRPSSPSLRVDCTMRGTSRANPDRHRGGRGAIRCLAR